MDTHEFTNVGDVYRVIEKLMLECSKHNSMTLYSQLDNAMRSGCTGLEIIGSIRKVLVENRAKVEELLGPAGKEETKAIIAFVDKAFGHPYTVNKRQ